MFNDARNETNGVSVEDPIETSLTTKGYLSDGCPSDRSLIINGGYGKQFCETLLCFKLSICSALIFCGCTGNDFFDVLRNKCVLDLNGESGDDSFTIRSFLLAFDPGECLCIISNLW